MNNWLCIKNGVVTNIIYCEEAFTLSDPWLLAHYDSFINKDTFPIPGPAIGDSIDSNGNWTLADHQNLSGQDFSNQDLTGRDFSNTNLTGCNFTGATIDGCDFSWTTGLNLVGAIWNGKTINHGPVAMSNPYYYCLLTDVVVIVGCAMAESGSLLLSSDEEKSTWDPSNEERPPLFWASVKDAYTAQLNTWANP